ncbi:hypothetical protein EDB83DRAFT_2323490 [Lactarius deliciosus]|nr:hypothetical protein EDB83DRAFT_2323490 [Lactarius deliciosus]
MVLIFVEYQWETSLVFDIALSEAVGTLKAQIQAIIGKPIARQRLQHIDEDSICQLLHRYHSPELEDEKNLEFYGISEGTILFLSDRPLSPIVFVKTLTGRTLRCEMALDWDVLMLKRVIQKKEGIPPHLQRLIYRGRQLNDISTLSSYGIQEEDVIYLVFRLSGGAPMRPLAYAYAIVLYDWDGDMGLKLIRGNAVVINEMVDENWYGGREPGEVDSVRRVFPSSYVKIKTFLDPDFQAAVPGCFPAKIGPMSFSEKADAENVVANIQLDESEPAPPLPAFNYETAPSYLRCDIADQGSSFVSVTFIPDQLVVPGDAVHVNVKLLCLAHDPRLRIVSVSLRVVVPDNEVRIVEPQKLTIGEGVVVVHRTDTANTGIAANIRLGSAGGDTSSTKVITTQRTGEEAISRDIRGDVDRNNAVWSIKDNGAQGIRGNVEELSFTLERQPGEFLCICSVSAMMEDGRMITRHIGFCALLPPIRYLSSGQKKFKLHGGRKLSGDERYRLAGDKFSLDPEEFRRAIRDSIRPEDAFISFIRDLQADAQGALRIFAMSNISTPDYEVARARPEAKEWSIFERVFISAAVGMRKPELCFFKSRGRLESETNGGQIVAENFAQLLILEATNKRYGQRFEWIAQVIQPPPKELVNYVDRPRTWNFFRERPVLTTDKFPPVLDTTSVGLMVTQPDDHVFDSVMDEMLQYTTTDRIPMMYFDAERTRTDPIVALNVLRLFYSRGHGHELSATLDWVVGVLEHRAYLNGTRYYETAECFLFFAAQLLRATPGVNLHARIAPLLRARIEERTGAASDDALAGCVVGLRLVHDLVLLLPLQCEDGGWGPSWIYKYGSSGVKIGNRGLTTALALNAIADLQSPPQPQPQEPL